MNPNCRDCKWHKPDSILLSRCTNYNVYWDTCSIARLPLTDIARSIRFNIEGNNLFQCEPEGKYFEPKHPQSYNFWKAMKNDSVF